MSWDFYFRGNRLKVCDIIENGEGFWIEFIGPDDPENGYDCPIAFLGSIDPEGKESVVVIQDITEANYRTRVLGCCSANLACQPQWVLYQLYIQFGVEFLDPEYEWLYIDQSKYTDHELNELYTYCCLDTMLALIGHYLASNNPSLLEQLDNLYVNLSASHDELVS